MTEAEWLACAEPKAILEFLDAKLFKRKLRLFGVSCCRHVWEMFPNETCRAAVEVAERFADGSATPQELTKVARLLRRQAFARGLDRPGQRARWIAWQMVNEPWNSLDVSSGTIELLGQFATPGKKKSARKDENTRQCASLRDIFGTPFRSVAFSPEWRTDTVLSLASQMYESRDFSAMPILADALQDASCDSDDILNHCRGDGPHVRGCWVVDLVLGKE